MCMERQPGLNFTHCSPAGGSQAHFSELHGRQRVVKATQPVDPLQLAQQCSKGTVLTT